jgi:hypothetical protein
MDHKHPNIATTAQERDATPSLTPRRYAAHALPPSLGFEQKVLRKDVSNVYITFRYIMASAKPMKTDWAADDEDLGAQGLWAIVRW